MEAKCSDDENIPLKGDPIYQWPEDLLQPTAVIFLELDEETRSQRMRERVGAETKEEKKLKEDPILRQR